MVLDIQKALKIWITDEGYRKINSYLSNNTEYRYHSKQDKNIDFEDYNGFKITIRKHSINKSSLKKSLYNYHKIYFNVPFNDKEKIKKEGGMWDKDKKCWYIIKSAKNKEIINKLKNEFTIKSI